MDINTKDYQYQLENIIAILPGHVYWKDLNGILLGCNDLQARDAGLSNRHDIVGKTDFDMPWKEQAEMLRAIDQEVIRTGKTITAEEISELANGTRAIFLSQKQPWYDEHGNIIGVVGISFEITAQKEAEQLRQEKEEAKKHAEYLRAFAGSIAHELRTPLASITMAAKFINDYWDILLSTYTMAQQAGMSIEEINPKRLLQLESRVESIIQQTYFSNAFIDLILGNLKDDSEFDTSTYQTYDIKIIIDSCLARYPFGHDEALRIHWDPKSTFTFKGDEFLMINVLNNLIKNALYYIKDARKGEIFIWLEPGPNDMDTLYFKDTAKGAPPEIVANLFQSFYSRRQGGTGLGLAFCKKIMKSFGGDITVKSVEGEYMQFALSFPPFRN